jgi:hypothetical protein
VAGSKAYNQTHAPRSDGVHGVAAIAVWNAAPKDTAHHGGYALVRYMVLVTVAGPHAPPLQVPLIGKDLLEILRADASACVIWLCSRQDGPLK